MKLLVNLGIFLTLIILSICDDCSSITTDHLIQVHVNGRQEKKQHVLHQFLIPLTPRVPDVNQSQVAHSLLQ